MFLTTRNFTTDPATDLVNFGSRINRLLNALPSLDWQPRDSATAAWVPAVDVFEEPESIRIVAEVPGVSPEDVKISLEGNVLTIQGTKQQVGPHVRSVGEHCSSAGNPTPDAIHRTGVFYRHDGEVALGRVPHDLAPARGDDRAKLGPEQEVRAEEDALSQRAIPPAPCAARPDGAARG